MNCLFHLQRQPGSFKERLIIKGFKTRDALHTFLNTSDNGMHWYELKSTMPTKPGTYAFAGGQWHNVKSLDISILAHI